MSHDKLWFFLISLELQTHSRNFSPMLALVSCILSKRSLIIFPVLDHNIILSDACKHKFKDDLFLCFHTLKKNTILRSIRSQIFFKIGVVKNFANSTRKHLCWSLFLIELQAFFIKKRLQHRFFPVKSVKVLRTPCFWILIHVRWIATLLHSSKS